MFDPTIFENLKVAMENQVYDLDNLTGQIEVINRKDLLEMAVMSREFGIEFILCNQQKVRAEIVLEASLKDLAAEILETPETNPGCTLRIRFYKKIANVPLECKQIEVLIQRIWDLEQAPTQTISFHYGEKLVYENMIEITFNRKINENQMGDIPELIKYILHTLTELNAI